MVIAGRHVYIKNNLYMLLHYLGIVAREVLVPTLTANMVADF